MFFLKHSSFLLLCISGAYHLSSFVCFLSFLCDVHKGKSGYQKKSVDGFANNLLACCGSYKRVRKITHTIPF